MVGLQNAGITRRDFFFSSLSTFFKKKKKKKTRVPYVQVLKLYVLELFWNSFVQKSFLPELLSDSDYIPSHVYLRFFLELKKKNPLIK